MASQSYHTGELQASEKDCLQVNDNLRVILKIILWFPRRHTCASTHTQAHSHMLTYTTHMCAHTHIGILTHEHIYHTLVRVHIHYTHTNTHTFLKVEGGSRAMVQQLKSPEAHAEDLSSVPSPHITTNCLKLVKGNMAPSSGTCGDWMHLVYRYTCRQNIHTHKVKINKC